MHRKGKGCFQHDRDGGTTVTGPIERPYAFFPDLPGHGTNRCWEWKGVSKTEEVAAAVLSLQSYFPVVHASVW